jgi:hypothetical protein
MKTHIKYCHALINIEYLRSFAWAQEWTCPPWHRWKWLSSSDEPWEIRPVITIQKQKLVVAIVNAIWNGASQFWVRRHSLHFLFTHRPAMSSHEAFKLYGVWHGLCMTYGLLSCFRLAGTLHTYKHWQINLYWASELVNSGFSTFDLNNSNSKASNLKWYISLW